MDNNRLPGEQCESMEIRLTRGQSAIVDEADERWLTRYKWFARKDSTTGNFYAARGDPSGKVFLMHREIIGASPGEFVDHRDHNTLNNRRANLRKCSIAENARNTRVRVDSASGLKGVSLRGGRWRARISVDGKLIAIGWFGSAVDAAKAYDAAARKHFGEFACLNFPDEAT